MNIHSLMADGATGDKREAILDAALELFASRGFHGTAVPEVARAAGVAAGTLYRYFDGKEALVNALYQREKLRFVSQVMSDFPLHAPPREQFKGLWWRLVAYTRQRPLAAMFLELHHHGSYLDAESRRLEEAVMQPVLEFVRAAQARQALKPIEPAALVAMVYGAFIGLGKAALIGQIQLDDALLERAEACLWEAVRL